MEILQIQTHPSPSLLHRYRMHPLQSDQVSIQTPLISVITDNSTRTCDTACHTTLPQSIYVILFYTCCVTYICWINSVFNVRGRQGWGSDGSSDWVNSENLGWRRGAEGGRGRAKPQKSLSLVKFCWWRAWMGNVIRNGGGGKLITCNRLRSLLFLQLLLEGHGGQGPTWIRYWEGADTFQSWCKQCCSAVLLPPHT